MKLRKKKSDGTIGAILILIAVLIFLIVATAIGSVIPAALAWVIMHFVFGASVTYAGVYWFIFIPLLIIVVLNGYFNTFSSKV
ncbi:hypothetical protein [Bacillus phage BC-T25]|nr:hypothetical protein [Bacillus phage BC-T25]